MHDTHTRKEQVLAPKEQKGAFGLTLVRVESRFDRHRFLPRLYREPRLLCARRLTAHAQTPVPQKHRSVVERPNRVLEPVELVCRDVPEFTRLDEGFAREEEGVL
jgi:hypothetical protein